MGDHVLSYDVPASAARAFRVYVEEIGSWWPGHLSADPAVFTGLRIEPWPGGRVYATYGIDEEDWGVVTMLQPGHLLQHTFGLPHRSPASTTVTVDFSDHDTGSRMTFRHSPWNGADALSQTKFGEWPIILGHYLESVRSTQRRG